MSGPKVIRVVTREELVERCADRFDDVQRAYDETMQWTRRAIAAGCLDAARTTLESIRAELEAHASRRAAEVGRTALLAGRAP